MEKIFINTKISKANEQQKFVLNLSKRLDLKILNKDFAYQEVSIYYTWKNVKKHYKNKKLKIVAPT